MQTVSPKDNQNNKPAFNANQPHMEVMPEIHAGKVVKVDPYKKSPGPLKVVLFVILGLVVLGGLACGGWYGYTNYLSKPSSSTLAEDSLQKMKSLKSYKVDFAMNVEIGEAGSPGGLLGPLFGASNNQILNIRGSGLVDNSDPSSKKTQGRIEALFGGPLFSFEMETKSLNDTNYIRVLDLPTELLGFLALADLDQKWIKIDPAQVNTNLLVQQEILKNWSQSEITNKIDQLKNIFKTQDLLTPIQKCYHDDFEDSRVIKCQFKLNQKSAQQVFQDLFKLITNDPQRLSRILEDDEWQDLLNVFNNVFVDIFYTTREHRLKVITVSFNNFDGQLDLPIQKIFFQLKYSQYNQPQKISMPTNVVGYNQLLDKIILEIEKSKQKSRDAKHVSDIKQLQAAFELYYLDHNQYPPVDGQVVLGQGDFSCLGQDGFGDLGECYGPYISLIPSNPEPGGINYAYTRTSSDTYIIEFKLDYSTGGLDAGKQYATQDGIGSDPPAKPKLERAEPTLPTGPDQKIISEIKTIQTALELYYLDHNAYPDQKGILGQANTSCLGGQGFSGISCPPTVYLSQILEGELPYVYIFDPQIGYYIFFSIENPFQDFKPGLIIATPSGISSASNSQDVDQDELPDQVENILGTHPQKSDSDNDGFLDGQEVKNGYNPLGEGKL